MAASIFNSEPLLEVSDDLESTVLRTMSAIDPRPEGIMKEVLAEGKIFRTASTMWKSTASVEPWRPNAQHETKEPLLSAYLASISEELSVKKIPSSKASEKQKQPEVEDYSEMFATSWHPTSNLNPSFHRQHVLNKPLPVSMHSTSPGIHSRRALETQNFEILNRGARRYRRSGRMFEPWDFSMISDAAIVLCSGKPASVEKPQRAGVSGSYFIRGERDILGVFKPVDEEPSNVFVEAMQDMGPPSRGSMSSTQSGGDVEFDFDHSCFPSGQGAFREVAAYILDHDNFSRVPQTALAQVNAELFSGSSPREGFGLSTADNTQPVVKQGAFQVYVSNLGDAEDFGPGVILTESVHRVAILDIRVLNCDRHPGNLLVVPTRDPEEVGRNKYEVIPIDHGFILPEIVPTCPWAVWMDWKQAKEPLSEKVIKYIHSLDADMDSKILKDELNGCIMNGSLLTLRIATHLLKKGVELGLSLYDIGTMVFCRNAKREESLLAKIGREALDAGMAREERLLGDDDDDDDDESDDEEGRTELGSNRTMGGEMFDMDDVASGSPVRARACSESRMALHPCPKSKRNHGHPVNTLSEGTCDFVVKYASRMIDEHLHQYVESMAKGSAHHGLDTSGSAHGGGRHASPMDAHGVATRALGRSLGRIRSIPDFANTAGTRKRRITPSPPPMYRKEEMANRVRALASDFETSTVRNQGRRRLTSESPVRTRPNLPPLPLHSNVDNHLPSMFPRLDLKHGDKEGHRHGRHYHHNHKHFDLDQNSSDNSSEVVVEELRMHFSERPLLLPELNNTLTAVVSSSREKSLKKSAEPEYSPISAASDAMVVEGDGL
eukprot:CAMPEP_0184693486 /NCGR_PEP_ID=MMETSP0313-20130426/1689_1 /TAXON_ID=2792 /ORGANISM="Porphyridium aerugineum, Strain SAG 1380-2" /LENGTH=834 /DNA_ID=CAMNT_0027151569 /DNA_START=963 /DNA_END=3467 /DNA_ORIENTATION=-